MCFPKAENQVLNSFLVETEFVEWLQAELSKRGWNVSEMVRRSQGLLSETQSSRVLSGTRGFGLEFLRGVATALGVPQEMVFRKAGWLPNHGEIVPEAKDWSARLMAFSEADRLEVMADMEVILRMAERWAGRNGGGRGRRGG